MAIVGRAAEAQTRYGNTMNERSRDDLRDRYRRWSTEDLLRVVADSDDHRPEAVEVAREILADREPVEPKPASDVVVRSSTGPIRIVVLLNVGPSFGGFRVAGRPGLLGLDNSSAFDELELGIQKAIVLLRAHPPSEWKQLASEESFRAAIPCVNGREGVIDVTGDATDNAEGDVLLRAFLPFAYWPLGGWAVYEGWRRRADGVWTPFSQDRLMTLW